MLKFIKKLNEEMKKERDKVIPKNYFYKPIFWFIMIIIISFPLHFGINFGLYNYYSECTDFKGCINPMYVCTEPLERECITQEQYDHNIQYVNGNYPNPEKKYLKVGESFGIKTPDYMQLTFLFLTLGFIINHLRYWLVKK